MWSVFKPAESELLAVVSGERDSVLWPLDILIVLLMHREHAQKFESFILNKLYFIRVKSWELCKLRLRIIQTDELEVSQ